MDQEMIENFLGKYGLAISKGDISAIARCWEVPCLVLSDQGAVAVSEAAEIERFFAQGMGSYLSQGLVETRPELNHVEALSERIAAVDVRWPAFDRAGVEKYSEHSYYILRLGDDGQPRIRAAITRA